MVFKKTSTTAVSLESPESMFRDIRPKLISGLHSHQADVLRDYVASAIDTNDVALQLPTGSGKTLVGMLLAEWRRRKFGERAVFLCPTIQLVNQVVAEANTKYGVKAKPFTGRKADYDVRDKSDYLNSDSIAVTTYSSLFNVNPFFDNPQLIVMDDAHSAENYLASFWSLQIDRNNSDHEPLFNALVGVLKQALSPLDLQRLTGESSSAWDKTWVEKIPLPTFHDMEVEVGATIDAYANHSNLRFGWSLLRSHLHACHMYVSATEILIRPLIPPSSTHAPFSGANQRIYMSATLGQGGDLERITGVERIKRLPAPAGWDKQGIGRRLFLFPGRSLDRGDEENLYNAMVSKAGRALVLVPDERRASSYREWVVNRLHYPVFDARQIESSKSVFTREDNAVAVVANRYDGIDFPNDECRLLIIEGLPSATNLQESFIVLRLGGITLLNDRILTRVIQAFGRCTRDANDYAAVVVWGMSF